MNVFLPSGNFKLGRSTSEGRWAGFGPYYAMFPVDFVLRQVLAFTRTNAHVIDPFCGRGTVPFVCQVTGRHCIGTDINAVAWLYASTKLDPEPDPQRLMHRVKNVLASVEPEDSEPQNDFQEWAWHTEVLAFLNAARRSLDWRNNREDRTLMGTILVHLHAKLGEGLSNQMRQSKSMSPAYAVGWWQQRGMRPPKIDLMHFFEKKFAWRYAKGIPTKRAEARVFLEDARTALTENVKTKADMVLTSPPYSGVTNYEYDNWIRLWMLGGACSPKVGSMTRFENKQEYVVLLENVFRASAQASHDDATIYVRTDARQFTLEATVRAMISNWPNHTLFCRYDKALGPTQTALFGNSWHKAGEVDLLMLHSPDKVPRGFVGV